jgi:hypothetical protein
MLTSEQFIALLDKYTRGVMSDDERTKFFEAISSGNYDELFSQHMAGHLQSPQLTNADHIPFHPDQMLHKILSSEKQNAKLLPPVSRRPKVLLLSSAFGIAAILLVLSIYLFRDSEDHRSKPFPVISADMVKKTNTSSAAWQTKLEDGTIVTLQPGASIHFPPHFLPAKRIVVLEGEAFFDVTKDSSRPFFVYHKNIVTHVLGTSFHIGINKRTGYPEVTVLSGRVEVYELKSEEPRPAEAKTNGVVLSPNQKVVYDEQSSQFISSVADKPLPIIPPTENEIPGATSYDETPLKIVLPYIEKTYGIEIVVENEALYNCLFTGDVSKQDLYTRLDVICQAVGSTYEIRGTTILIRGKGCN